MLRQQRERGIIPLSAHGALDGARFSNSFAQKRLVLGLHFGAWNLHGVVITDELYNDNSLCVMDGINEILKLSVVWKCP